MSPKVDTRINIIIRGYDATRDGFGERLEHFLSVGQPWSGDPNVRVGFSIQPPTTDEPPAT